MRNFIIIFATLLLAEPVFAKTFYIDANPARNCFGNYSIARRNCSGSDGNSYNTFAGAEAVATLGGDIVYIREGTYTGKTTFNANGGGSYITYQNYNGETVWVDGQDRDDYPMTITGDWIKFDGINVKRMYHAAAGGPHGAGYYVTMASNIDIRNCRVTDGRNKGIKIYAADEVTIYNATVDHIYAGAKIRAHGIQIIGSTDVDIDSCDVSYSSRQGIQIAGEVSPSTRWTRRVYIKNTVIHHNDNCGINTEPYYTEKIVVDGCTIRDNNRYPACAEAGFRMNNNYIWVINSTFYNNLTGIGPSGKHNIVRNNVFYSNNWTPNGCYGPTGLETRDGQNYQFCVNDIRSDHIAVIHNTFHNEGNASSGCGESNECPGAVQFGWNTSGISESPSPGCYDPKKMKIRWGGEENGDSIFVNNIVYEPGAKYAAKMAMSSNGNFARVDYNNYYDSSNLRFSYNKVVNDYSAGLSFSAWQASEPGLDANSIITDPDFVDGSGHDYNLNGTSNDIDAGGFLTFATNSGSNSKSLVVDNPDYFCDGYGVRDGDIIKIGFGKPVLITHVDYRTGAITLNASRAWNKGDNVSFDYSGSGPDIGAYEYGYETKQVPTAPKNLRVIGVD